MQSLKSEKLPKVEKPKVNKEDLIKNMGGLNITINLSPNEAVYPGTTYSPDTAKKKEVVNAEMLKIMKKENNK